MSSSRCQPSRRGADLQGQKVGGVGFIAAKQLIAPLPGQNDLDV